MKNKLEELRKNILIEVYSWAGLSPTPGRSGFIVTKDQNIYYYHEYQRIIKFIEEKILNKSYEYIQIFDASFHIVGNYNNQYFNIINHTDLYEEINKIIRGGK